MPDDFRTIAKCEDIEKSILAAIEKERTERERNMEAHWGHHKDERKSLSGWVKTLIGIVATCIGAMFIVYAAGRQRETRISILEQQSAITKSELRADFKEQMQEVKAEVKTINIKLDRLIMMRTNDMGGGKPK